MKTIFTTALTLFLVLDPVGNIPAFLHVLSGTEPTRQRRIILRELLIALAILVFFLFAGQYLLIWLHISQSSLGMAGGIILFMIAIRLVFPSSGTVFGDTAEGEPFIVPLAVPLIAGPSSMAVIMLLMARQRENWPYWLAAILIAWTVSGVILMLAHRLLHLLGRRVLTAIERLMGLILTTVAVEMFVNGLEQAIGSR